MPPVLAPLGGLLQAVQGRQQGLEGAVGQGLRHVLDLVAQEGIQPLGLVDALGLVTEQHRIAVEAMRTSCGWALLAPADSVSTRAAGSQVQRLITDCP